jgi:DNA-binding MarR family transcriptional regulator
MPPPLSDQELAAWRGMLEVHADVMRRLDAQMRAAHGLSVSAYEVLMFLGDAPAHRMRMSDLAQSVLLSRSGATRLVDRLVARGDVTRCVDSDDGRGLHAEITDAGLATLRAARATHHQGVREFFLNRLGDADQLTLGKIWARLREPAGSRAMDQPPARTGS